ncbi:DUF7373 family lipoprotein [Nocardia bhagyanarayanae]|uniref:DUF7373 family lipoprotein n=1 Tax=Nocardia bhagyanarayanae TaxID=1215925 RepID=UPI001152DDE1|nr:hypothetical protein [Nocardia bhagyanarayanae]
MTRVLAVVAVLAVLGGCTVAGKPVAVQTDPAKLDVGPYRAEPATAPSNDNEAYGRVLESVRMGEAVIDPIEADASLTFGLGATASVPIPTPAKAGFLAQPVRAVLERHGMLAGFSVGGMDRELSADVAVGRARLLTVMLLRFPDDESARRAAADIDAVDFAVSTENVAVPVPDHAGAHAHWRPAVPTLAATLAHGPFVVSVLAGHTAPDLAALTALARAAFTAQIARLRDFEPTPRDRFAALPFDRDEMLARVLPEAPGVWPYPAVIVDRNDQNAGWRTHFKVSGVVYGPRAAHRWGSWEKDADADGTLLAINGAHYLVRHPNVAVARRAFDETASDATDPGHRAAPAPFGLPDSRCVESLSGPRYGLRFACRVLYRAYEGIVYGRTVKDAQQKAAAQYVLLVRSE